MLLRVGEDFSTTPMPCNCLVPQGGLVLRRTDLSGSQGIDIFMKWMQDGLRGQGWPVVVSYRFLWMFTKNPSRNDPFWRVFFSNGLKPLTSERVEMIFANTFEFMEHRRFQNQLDFPLPCFKKKHLPSRSTWRLFWQRPRVSQWPPVPSCSHFGWAHSFWVLKRLRICRFGRWIPIGSKEGALPVVVEVGISWSNPGSLGLYSRGLHCFGSPFSQ